MAMLSPTEIPPALILVNLGTPTSPTPQAVRQFLKIFLSDRRVVDLPRLLWLPLLHGVILPFRAPKVARLYEKIWWKEGSPLRVITERQVKKLSTLLFDPGYTVPVRMAMVYGEPSLEQVMRGLIASGTKKIVVLPLYPQFCSATTGSVCDQVNGLRKKFRDSVYVELVKSYHDEPAYIAALSESIQRHWRQNGRGEKLLFSFHGIPQALADSGDPYFRQCHETAKQVATKLELEEGSWQVAFQSRFGRAEWVKPYTDQVIQELARQGMRCIDVITPAFASDCLETLEEIAVQNAAQFTSSGGKQLRLIPCLNDDEAHIHLLAMLFRKQLSFSKFAQ